MYCRWNFALFLVRDLIYNEVMDKVEAQVSDWAVDLARLVIASGLIEQSKANREEDRRMRVRSR